MTMQAIEDLKTAFEQFKRLNDEKLGEIEQGGSASAASLAAVNTANAAITEAQNRLTQQTDKTEQRLVEVEDRLTRDRMGGLGQKVSDETLLGYANWQSVITGRHVDPAGVDLDVVRNYSRSFQDWFRHGQNSSPEALRILNEMSVGSDSDGGYWVDPDTNGRVATLVYESSPIRQFAGVQEISTDALEGTVDLDEASTGGWMAENATRSGNTGTPEIGTWRIPVHEQYAEPRATQKLLDDALIDVGAWLGGKVASKFRRDENTAFATGSGITQPRGFMTYDAGTPSAADWQKIEQVVSGNASTLLADGLVDLIFALKRAYRQGSVFGMNRTTEREVRQLKDGNSNYLWQPDFQQRSSASLLGFPVVEMADLADIAANALPIVFGNLGASYQIVDRTGIRVLRDPYTTKGYVKFYTTKRTGGDVINTEAIKIQKVST